MQMMMQDIDTDTVFDFVVHSIFDNISIRNFCPCYKIGDPKIETWFKVIAQTGQWDQIPSM